MKKTWQKTPLRGPRLHPSVRSSYRSTDLSSFPACRGRRADFGTRFAPAGHCCR